MENKNKYCPICSKKAKFSFFGKDLLYKVNKKQFGVYLCKSCLCQFISPKTPNKILSFYYPKKYYSYTESQQPITGLKKIKFQLLTNALYSKKEFSVSKLIAVILNYLFNFELYFGIPEKQKNKASFLDIGCGDGEIVYFLRKFGWKSFGFEIGKKKYQRQIYFNSNLLRVNFFNKKFNVIRLSHVLEHLNNPDDYLNKIYKLLKKKGLLYLSLPSSSSLNAKIFSKYWMGYDVPRHQINYNFNNLLNLLNKHGFKLIKYQYNSNMFTQSLSWFLEDKFNIKISFHFIFYILSTLFYKKDCLSLKLQKK